MTAPLPDRWEDEPWPLDDPVPAPSLRPTNWSDTHADPPQVADLADEAWQRAVDRGISMERALAELQREAEFHREVDRVVWHGSGQSVTLNGVTLSTGGIFKMAGHVRISTDWLRDSLHSPPPMRRGPTPTFSVIDETHDWDKETADAVLRQVRAERFFLHQTERYLSRPRSLGDIGGAA